MTAVPGTVYRPSRIVLGLSVALLCLIWGSTWIVIREGLQDLPPFTSAAARFAVAWLVMLVVAPALSRREGGVRPSAGLVVAMGVCNFAASYGIVYWSETVLPSGLVSVLWSVFPMMMAVSGHLFLAGEHLFARQWLGFGVGFSGVVLLFRTDIAALGPEAVPAGALLLVSPTVAAIGTTLVKRHGSRMSSVLLNRDGMLLAAVLLGLVALATERGADVRWSASAVTSVLYLAVVGTVVTFGLYFWAMRYAPANQLSLIAYVIPAIALFLGATFGDEPVGPATIAGAGLILAGCAVVLLAAPAAGATAGDTAVGPGDGVR